MKNFQGCCKPFTQKDDDPRVGVDTALRDTQNETGCQFTNEVLERNAAAIVLIVPDWCLIPIKGTDQYTLLTDMLKNQVFSNSHPDMANMRICPKYYAEMQAAPVLGTGFFYADNIIITAGHVWKYILDAYYGKKKDLSNIRLIRRHITQENLTFNSSDIYRIDHGADAKNAGDWFYNQYKDWAWMYVKSLDPKNAANVNPLPVSEKPIAENTGLYMMGHGFGLPMMFSFNWENPFSGYDEDPYSELFECKLGSYAGNSGSPVFRTDTAIHEVVGIVSGDELTRYHFSVEKKCIQPKVELGLNFGIKIAKLEAAVKSILKV